MFDSRDYVEKISRPWNPGPLQSTQVIECGTPKKGPNGLHSPPKHIFWCTEGKPTLVTLGCTCLRGKKKGKKHARVQLPHLPTPFASAIVFCVWGRTVDIFKHAKFKMNRFMGFGAPGAENYPHPLTSHIALTTAHAVTYDAAILSNWASLVLLLWEISGNFGRVSLILRLRRGHCRLIL